MIRLGSNETPSKLDELTKQKAYLQQKKRDNEEAIENLRLKISSLEKNNRQYDQVQA